MGGRRSGRAGERTGERAGARVGRPAGRSAGRSAGRPADQSGLSLGFILCMFYQWDSNVPKLEIHFVCVLPIGLLLGIQEGVCFANGILKGQS